MKAIKRTVAALLATLMLATSTSFTLAAETYTDDEAVVVAKVNAAGIMTGTDKGFEPSKSLTRAEAAAIIVRMKGISESAVKSMAGTTLFNDVAASHWASGYINQASNLQIVKGVSATEFAPEREVTVAEFTTMAVRALGAGQLVDSEGTWPTNYVNFANEEGILDDVNAIYTATASRMNAATIVANTLVAPMWVKAKATTNKEVTWEKQESNGVATETILADTLKIVPFTNVVLTSINTKDRKVGFTFKSDDYSLDVADGVDMKSLKAGIEYDIWFNNNTKVKEVVGIWNAEDSKQDIVEFSEIKDLLTNSIKFVLDNGTKKEYNIKSTTAFYYNGLAIKDSAATPLLPGEAGYAVAQAYTNFKAKFTKSSVVYKDNVFGKVKLNGDDIIAVYAERYENVGIVDSVSSTRVKFATVDSKAVAMDSAKSFVLDDENKIYNLTKNGKAINAEDLEEGDVVFYYPTSETDVFNGIVATELVSGKVTATGTDYVKINGKKYEYVSLTSALTTGIEVDAYLNDNGKIIMWDEIDGESSEYAVISSLEFVENNKGIITADVELTFVDGSKHTYELDAEKTAKEIVNDDTADEFIISMLAGQVAVAKDAIVSATKYATLTGAFNTGAAASAVTGINDASGKAVADLYAANASDVKTLNRLFSKNTLEGMEGVVVGYSVKGDKVVITEFVSDDLPVKSTTGKLVVKSTKSYIADGAAKYYFTNNTKILTVEASSSKAYKADVEVVELDSLNSSASANLAYRVADVNDENEVKLVVLYANYDKDVEDAKYAVVLGIESLDEDEDYDYGYSVVYTDGETATYYSDSNSVLTPGDLVQLKLDGEEVTGFRTSKSGEFTLTSTLVDDTYYAKDLEDNGLVKYVDKVTDGTATEKTVCDSKVKTYVLAKDVVFIKVTDLGSGSYKYAVGTDSDINLVELDETDDTAGHTLAAAVTRDEATPIYFLTETDNEGNIEVVAIAYVK